MKFEQEIKIGIFSIVIILVSIWGYQFLKGKNILAKSNVFYAQYETVEQLPNNAEVLLRGKRIGTVTDIFFSEAMEHITIELDIDRSIPVPKDARVHIVSMGIASQKAVELVFDRACQGDNCAQSGDYLVGMRKGLIESMVDKEELQEYLMIVGEGLGGIIDTLIARFEEGEETSEILRTFQRLGNTVSNLERITTRVDHQLARSGDGISEIVHNTSEITGKVKQQVDSLGLLLANLNQVVEELAQQDIGQRLSGTFDRADEGMKKFTESMEGFNSLITALNEGEGSLGKLLKDPEMAESLERSLTNLNLLLQDIRLNPGRYTHFKVTLFGRGNRTEYVYPIEDPADQ